MKILKWSFIGELAFSEGFSGRVPWIVSRNLWLDSATVGLIGSRQTLLAWQSCQMNLFARFRCLWKHSACTRPVSRHCWLLEPCSKLYVFGYQLSPSSELLLVFLWPGMEAGFPLSGGHNERGSAVVDVIKTEDRLCPFRPSWHQLYFQSHLKGKVRMEGKCFLLVHLLKGGWLWGGGYIIYTWDVPKEWLPNWRTLKDHHDQYAWGILDGSG